MELVIKNILYVISFFKTTCNLVKNQLELGN